MGWSLVRFLCPKEPSRRKHVELDKDHGLPVTDTARADRTERRATECVLSLCLPLSAPGGPMQNSCFALSLLLCKWFYKKSKF